VHFPVAAESQEIKLLLPRVIVHLQQRVRKSSSCFQELLYTCSREAGNQALASKSYCTPAAERQEIKLLLPRVIVHLQQRVR
jgi:hypothetical protein